jgi:hypothetical protein
MESVSHSLWKEKRWGWVPSFIKGHKSANLSLKNLLYFCMEDSKNPIASRWQRQLPLSVLQMKSSSTCLITASLCEGPFFYFYVESPPSIFHLCFFHVITWLLSFFYQDYIFHAHVLSSLIPAHNAYIDDHDCVGACHIKNYFFVITYLLEDEQELSIGILDTSQTYLQFLMLHACLYTIFLVFCYTS